MNFYRFLPCFCLLLPLSASATVRYVDLNSPGPAAPFTTWATAATNIQDAIDVAMAGDEIVVTNGVYATGGRAVFGTMTNRVVVDKALTLRSVNGPQFTSIQGYQLPGTTNGNGAVRCVYLSNGASLYGFTLIHGATRSAGDFTREQGGGGLLCESTTAIVSNCVLTGNSASYGGGSSSGTLYNCTLSGNTAYNPSTLCEGGGAEGGILNNCVLIGNSTTENGGGASGAALINCTLALNRAGWGGGAANCQATNCILYFNTGNYGANFYYNTGSSGEAVIAYCCTTPLPANGIGNITPNPVFADLAGGNLRLQSGSPCINVGNNALAAGGTDLDGRPRILGSVVDMGAYEFQVPGSSVAPYLIWQPTDQTAHVGSNVTFSFEGGGTAPLAYQWNFNGSPLANATNAALALTNVALSQAGNYAVTITNLAGSITSSNALLIVPLAHYVDASGSNPVPPYTNWATAAANIQDAVDTAATGDEIIVTNGVYATGGRAVFGTMTNRVVVNKPLALRSVNGPQFTIIQGYQVPETTNGDGAIRCVYLANGASLSGFTLTNGATQMGQFWPPAEEGGGGGVWCESTNAVVSDCLIIGNSAWSGGGAYSGALQRCELRNNTAYGVYGVYMGGGGTTSANLDRCIVINNYGTGCGGILRGTANCSLILSNSPDGSSFGVLNNCVVAGNLGDGVWAGVQNNCTIVGNTHFGAIGARFPGTYDLCVLNNCIVYHNSNGNLTQDNFSYYTVSNTCTYPELPQEWQQWPGAANNITNEPKFMNLAAGDFRLQPDSPCINAGNNIYAPGPTDFDGNPRIVGSAVDMGAYEFQSTQPMLKIMQSGMNILLAWPLWASDFELQQAFAFPPSPNDWASLMIAPGVTNNENEVALPISAESKLFRLFKP